jgi:pyruvyltransferase
MIRFYAWTDIPNFGDAMSRDIIEWVSRAEAKLVLGGDRSKLMAVGSILQYARPGDVIWGTGVHPGGYEAFWRDTTPLPISVLAVRGPITRDVLLARQVDCPEIYGDPAILAPMLYPRRWSPTEDAILIPHFLEYDYYASNREASLGLRVVNPLSDWHEIVDAITSARKVISSSLHGLIVAEAYGVPAIWFRPSQSEGYLKYQDYYGSTNRAPFPTTNLRNAIEMHPEKPPDYSEMRTRLLSAFDETLVTSICSFSETAKSEHKRRMLSTKPPGTTVVIDVEKATNASDFVFDSDFGYGVAVTPSSSTRLEKKYRMFLDFECDEGVYAIWSLYAAAEERPLQIFVDNDTVSLQIATSTTGGWYMSHLEWHKEVRLKLSQGKHRIEISRDGWFPHLACLALVKSPPSLETF